MSKQELNLFEFAAAIVAESGTSTTKVVGRQIGDAGLSGTPLDRIGGDFPSMSDSARQLFG